MTKKQLYVIIGIWLPLIVIAVITFSYDYEQATIAYVDDGDTFQTVKGDWIRLARIDTPEQDQAGYKEAKQWLARYEGKQVELNCFGRGYYDRRICEVFHNDTNLNNKLLNLNLAEKYD